MRTVRIWVKLRCSPEQLFGLDVLAVIPKEARGYNTLPRQIRPSRLLYERPLLQLPSYQADHARPPKGSGTLRSDPQQATLQATLSPVVRLSLDLHLSFLEIWNRATTWRWRASCQLLWRQ